MNVQRTSLIALKAGVLFSVLAAAFAAARSSLIFEHRHIATAITIDLLITLPLLYLFFIRRSAIPKLTVLPVFVLSVLAASFILPSSNRDLLDLAIVYAVPVLELAALVFFGAKIYRSRKRYRSLGDAGNDVPERLRKVLMKELSLAFAARAAAFELGMFYLAFFRWRRPKTGYTYHKRSGVLPVIAVLIGTVAVETVVVHYFVGLWNVKAAWIFSAISVYFVIQLFAHSKAVLLRPVEIREGRIFIRCGLVGDTEIELSNIESVDLNPAQDNNPANSVTASALGNLTPPNVHLTIRTEAVFYSFYGILKPFTTIRFGLDEPEAFAAELSAAIESRKCDPNRDPQQNADSG